MAMLVEARLTVLGAQSILDRLDRGNWDQKLKARYVDVWERSKTRRVWLFQMEPGALASLHPLRLLSSRWPGLVFLLDYEDQKAGRKGLAKTFSGKMDACEFTI